MAEKKGSYVGRIGNTGAQIVQAPLVQPKPKGKSIVHEGKDLRAGKK